MQILKRKPEVVAQERLRILLKEESSEANKDIHIILSKQVFRQHRTIIDLKNKLVAIQKALNEHDIQIKQATNIQNLLNQNESNRQILEATYELKSSDEIDTKTLDGLLSDYVDSNENSQELVESVRRDE